MQPLVENSIWHGLMNISYKGSLKVEFTKEKNKLVCIVEDNGVGLIRSQHLKGGDKKDHESKGMKMIEDRLKAWSQIKDIRCTFKIFDRDPDPGTRTEITILYPPYV